MKKNLHIFLSNNFVTALRIVGNNTETLFSEISLSQHLEKVSNCLMLYHEYPIHLVIDNTNISIKTYNIIGMNRWHKYELRRRLQHESSSHDWHSFWEENSKLILVKGELSDVEKTFLQMLNIKRFLIESAAPALWMLTNLLLKGHIIKQNGIVRWQAKTWRFIYSASR